MSLNKVMLIGNLGKDPEVRHFEGGGKIVKFSLATSESFTNKEGQKIDQTTWHNIVVSRRGLADVCEKYLHKGMKIFAEGKLRNRQWEENGQTRYITEINLDNMTMLSPKNESENPGKQDSPPPPIQPVDDDDLPF